MIYQESRFLTFKKELLTKLKKEFTILFVPHSTGKPIKLSIPLFIIYILTSLIFILLIYTSLVIGKHINYIKTITNSLVLENKVKYLSKELIENRNFLQKLKEVDSEMRMLLGLKTKKAVIDAAGIGGPSPIDEINLNRILNNNLMFTRRELEINVDLLEQEISSRLNSSKEIFNHINKQKALLNSRPKIWPTTGRISSPYGYRYHPFKGRREFHKGIDIAAPKGTPVLATADGKVVYSNWLGGYGKVIIINHGHNYKTRYGHMLKLKVKRGAFVKRGQIIGTVGSTGISTGSHLHYEVRYKNQTKNPLKYVNERTRPKR